MDNLDGPDFPYVGAPDSDGPNLAQFQPPPLPLVCDGEIVPNLAGRYLIKGLIGTANKIVVFGPPGCGKSFLAFDMGRHGARGLDWFGRRTRQFTCAYLAAEGQAGLFARHEAWSKQRPSETQDPFGIIPTAVDLLDPQADLPKVRATLDFFVRRFSRLDLLVVDTLAATIGGGDENTSDMAAYVANVEKLRAHYACSAIIIHHSPLDATAKRPRGHGSLWAAADTVLFVSGDRDAPARRLHVLKQKDGDPGPDIMFGLKQVVIGVDEDGDTVTSCVVEPSELQPIEVSGRRRLSPKEAIVKAALERTLASRGTFPPSTIPDNILNRARTSKVVRTTDWRAESVPALTSSDTKPDTARRTFDRARESLQAAEIVGVWEEWSWLVF